MDASKVECRSDSDVTSSLSMCKPELITAEPGDGQVSEPIVQLHSKVTSTTLTSLWLFIIISFSFNFLAKCLKTIYCCDFAFFIILYDIFITF